MVFDQPELSDLNVSFWQVLVPAVSAVVLFGGAIVFLVGRSLWVAQTAGVDELIGLIGRATTALDPAGKVFVRGEYWNAVADGSVALGESVEAIISLLLQLHSILRYPTHLRSLYFSCLRYKFARHI